MWVAVYYVESYSYLFMYHNTQLNVLLYSYSNQPLKDTHNHYCRCLAILGICQNIIHWFFVLSPLRKFSTSEISHHTVYPYKIPSCTGFPYNWIWRAGYLLCDVGKMRTKAAFIGENSSLLTGHTDEQPSTGSLLHSDMYCSLITAFWSVAAVRGLPIYVHYTFILYT